MKWIVRLSIQASDVNSLTALIITDSESNEKRLGRYIHFSSVNARTNAVNVDHPSRVTPELTCTPAYHHSMIQGLADAPLR
jgi:hypothetical protein